MSEKKNSKQQVKRILTRAIVAALVLTIIVVLGSALLGPVLEGPLTPVPNCLYSGKAMVWVDSNENGIWEPNELPLPETKLFIGGLDPDLTEDRVVISNANGEAQIRVWSDGCLPLDFDINVQVPAEYYPTTLTHHDVAYQEHGKIEWGGETYWRGETYFFGMALLSQR